MKSKVSKTAFVLLIVLQVGLLAYAQQNVGSIKGRVGDPSAAMIVSASVVARHEATGIEKQVSTGAEGIYVFSALPIGSYLLKVSAPGFKTAERAGVRVVSAETVVVDFELPVGEVTEKVSVTADVPVIDVMSSKIGTTRTNEEINDLPLSLNGGVRTAMGFIKTVSGVSWNPQQSERQDMYVASRATYNGAPGGAASYLIEGLMSGTTGNEQAEDFSAPLPEEVAEFRIIANDSAEYGWNTGPGISMTLKSGGNDLHGSLLYYFRNEALDARNWFADKVSINKQNEFGAVVGGPIIKNKTFFFASYDGFRLRNAPGGRVGTVPTDAMRRGDFRELLGPQVGTDALGRPIFRGQIYDPKTTRSDGAGGFIRDPFPNNIIPADRLSSISQTFQKGYPLPNGPGLQLNYAGPQVPSPIDRDRASFKIDHHLGTNHTLSFTWDKLLSYAEIQTFAGIALAPEIHNTGMNYAPQHRSRINYLWTIRPNLVFNFRGGYTSRKGRTVGVVTNGGKQVFGMSAMPSADYGAKAGLTGVQTPETPPVAIQGVTGFGTIFRKLEIDPVGIPVSADLAWTKGSHNIKVGADFYALPFHAGTEFGTAGNFSFTDRVTGFPGITTTGSGYASYLLGEVDSATLTPGISTQTWSGGWGFYAQDQWRVTPKLTLNYGFRYDLFMPPRESADKIGGFDPLVPNPKAGGRLGGLTFWGQGAGMNGRHQLLDNYYGAVGPRFGFAYMITPKTVISGSYGISYVPLFGVGASGNNAPRAGWGGTFGATTLDNGLTPAFNWNTGFPVKVPAFPILDVSYLNGFAINLVDPHDNKAGRAQNISFGVSRELPGGLALRADYVGNWIHGLASTNLIQLNQIDQKYLSLGNLLLAPVTSPQAQAAGIPLPYPGFTGSVAQALRPYPQYQGISQQLAMTGFHLYNALQLNLQKRFGKGFSFLVAYTASKAFGNGNFGNQGTGSINLQHTDQRNLAKQLQSTDRPQSLAISYTYDLPFGPGKPFLTSENPFVKQVVGGWQVAAIQSYFSATPLTVTTTQTIPGGVGAIWALRVPDKPILTGVSCGDYDPNNPSRNQFLNINAFQTPPPFTFGNTSQLPSTRACGYLNESLSVLKTFPVRERVDIKFGAHFFNLLNRHQWIGLASNLGVPGTFGRYTGASDPRTIQFSLKVQF